MDAKQLKREMLLAEVKVNRHCTIANIGSTIVGIFLGFIATVAISMVITINGIFALLCLVVSIIVIKLLSKFLIKKVFQKKDGKAILRYQEAEKELSKILDDTEDFLLNKAKQILCDISIVEPGISKEQWWGKRKLNVTFIDDQGEEDGLSYTLNSIDDFISYLQKFEDYGYEFDKYTLDYIYMRINQNGSFLLDRKKPDAFEEHTPITPETSPREKALFMLGLSGKPTKEEIKKAYREKSKDFHPDAIQGKGLNDIFIKFAEEQFKALTDAYDLLTNEA